MPPADALIHTKLRLPFTRTELVPRPRLQEQIRQGLRGPLTLVTAPAGFGKTTLVASCISGFGLHLAWLSLDKEDNQVERFMGYLLAALQEAMPGIGSQTERLLATAAGAPPEDLLTSLINDLDQAVGGAILVLDDYQFISNPAVHELVAFVLEHCPAPLHVLIISRSDPPLPLARLRARGQTVELRTGDLRFSMPEATEFLNQVMGLDLDSGAVAALAGRTEGWIAGLQMAALSMRGGKDIAKFIAGFSGTNRYILDYLVEEVLASQPPEIQRFLLFTSPLERLTGSLCDSLLDEAVLPGSEGESNRAGRDSHVILDNLERANLFLVPLDDDRLWYRYHHLFADLLRAQLQKSIDKQSLVRLHLHASEWYERHHLPLDAIHHASLAGDFERIERLIEDNYFELLNRGEAYLVRYWMGQLSKDLIHRRPWLCLYEAFSRSWFGRPDEATLLLNQAETLIQTESRESERRGMLGYHHYVLSRVTAMQGDTNRAIQYCLEARQNTPEENVALDIEMSITLGFEYFLEGNYARARETLEEMLRTCFAVGAVNNPVAAYCILARIEANEGKLQRSLAYYEKAAQLLRESGGDYPGVYGLVETGMAGLWYEWNELEVALNHVQHGLDLLPSWGKIDDTCLAYACLGQIQLARRDLAGAADTLSRASQALEASCAFSEARRAVEITRLKVWLAQDDWPSIERWRASFPDQVGEQAPPRYEDELIQIMAARLDLAQGKTCEAIRRLTPLQSAADSAGRNGRLIEVLVLLALAQARKGMKPEAHASLERALSLAEPSGYLRAFLDEGSPMQTLLSQWLARHALHPLRPYASQVIAGFAAHAVETTPAHQPTSIAGGLIEPLTPRELEVLHLVAAGKANTEIAALLYVSPGTVKTHTASIYRKLAVANRTEAAARARQLGLLS